MQTTKVHNYIHFMGWFTQFERKCNILEIFHYFQYFERCRSMKKWQISKPKIVDWSLKSVISSFKICFQNSGQLKRKFLRPKNTSSAFLKFELSSFSGPMLKTRENTIRNQFEQQWFEVISFQKPRRVYPAIWYNLKPFANRKGRFKLSIPAKCTLSKGKSLIKKVLKFNTFYVQEIRFSVQNNVVSVCCSYLNMVFPYIGNVKYPHGRTDQQQHFKSKRKISNAAKIALHFTKRPLTTVVTLCMLSLEAARSFYSLGMILDQRFLESTNPVRIG